MKQGRPKALPINSNILKQSLVRLADNELLSLYEWIEKKGVSVHTLKHVLRTGKGSKQTLRKLKEIGADVVVV